jgi:hypothetical protein
VVETGLTANWQVYALAGLTFRCFRRNQPVSEVTQLCFDPHHAGCTRSVLTRQMPRVIAGRAMQTTRPVRRLVVAVVGLASVATVLLPGGYLEPVVKRAGGAIVRPVTPAPPDCSVGDMADMTMPMPADCTSP